MFDFFRKRRAGDRETSTGFHPILHYVHVGIPGIGASAFVYAGNGDNPPVPLNGAGVAPNRYMRPAVPGVLKTKVLVRDGLTYTPGGQVTSAPLLAEPYAVPGGGL